VAAAEPVAAAVGAPPSDVLAVLDAFTGSGEEEDDDDVGHLGAFGAQFGADSPRGLPSGGLLPPALTSESAGGSLHVLSDADLACSLERPAEVRRVTAPPMAGGALGAMQKGMLGELGAVLKASGPKPGAITRKESSSAAAPDWKKDLQKRKSFAAAGLPVGAATERSSGTEGGTAGEREGEGRAVGGKPAWKIELEQKQRQAAARCAPSTEPATASASVPAAGEETAALDVPAWKKDLQKRKSVAAAPGQKDPADATTAGGGVAVGAGSVPSWKAELQAKSKNRATEAAGASPAGEASTSIREPAAQGGVPKWKEELLSKQGKSAAPTSGEKSAPGEAAGEEPPWKKELRQRKSFVATSPAAAGSSNLSVPAGRDDDDSAGELAAILQRRKEKAQSST